MMLTMMGCGVDGLGYRCRVEEDDGGSAMCDGGGKRQKEGG